MSKSAPSTKASVYSDPKALGQVVLVFQGGGALGAYQAGVYQAISEAGIEPDWVIGTSIGAINAALIAGNAPENRLARLREFWLRVRHSEWSQLLAAMPRLGAQAAHGPTFMNGINGFFEPNPMSWFGLQTSLGPERAGFYSTAPLEKTLTELVDVDRLHGGETRLTVGAAHVQSGEMRYFDSRDEVVGVRHVMASGALPPAFPAVRIDGDLYWDGGILSNTPVEAVFDDYPRRSSVVFAVHVWSPTGPEPDSILNVIARQKDLQYASRAKSHITRQRQIYQLRQVISELAAMLPSDVREKPDVKALSGYGCRIKMHVVRLLASPLKDENHLKDIDFSPEGIQSRWDAGYLDTSRVLAQSPWDQPHDPHEGFILHEARAGALTLDDVQL